MANEAASLRSAGGCDVSERELCALGSNRSPEGLLAALKALCFKMCRVQSRLRPAAIAMGLLGLFVSGVSIDASTRR